MFDCEALRNTLYMTPPSKSQMLSDSMCESRNNITKKLQSLTLWSAKNCDVNELKETLKRGECHTNLNQRMSERMTQLLPTDQVNVEQDRRPDPSLWH